MSRKEKRAAKKQHKRPKPIQDQDKVIKRAVNEAMDKFGNTKKEVINNAVIDYSTAMLYVLRKKMKFGRKRAMRFSDWVIEVFDDINSGKAKIEDFKAIIENELRIKID